MSAHLIEFVAEGLSLLSILALVVPAVRLVRLQGHSARMSNIANRALAGNDKDTADLARELDEARRSRADRFYMIDAVFLWIGIILAVGASAVKLILILSNQH